MAIGNIWCLILSTVHESDRSVEYRNINMVGLNLGLEYKCVRTRSGYKLIWDSKSKYGQIYLGFEI